MLDVIRFVAALAVVLYHYSGSWGASGSSPLIDTALRAWLKYGELGVPLFFMVSGFVIAMSAQQVTAAHFIWARGLRLWPAFFICCSLTALAQWIDPATATPSLWQFFANLTMAPALFKQTALDGVYWTLLIEMKFYFWIAALIALRMASHIHAWSIAWLSLAAIDLFVRPTALLETLFVSPWAPYFAGGAIVYRARQQGWTGSGALLYVCCTMMAVACFLQTKGDRYADKHADAGDAAGATLTVLMFIGVALLARTGTADRSTRWVIVTTALGGISYPLYLLHNLIGRHFLPRWADLSPWLTHGAAVLAAIVLAAIVWRFGERPLRALIGHHIPPCFRPRAPAATI